MAHTVSFTKGSSVTIPDTSRLRLVFLDSSFNEIERLSLGGTSTTVPSSWTHTRLIQANGVVVLGFVITNNSDATWGPNANGEHYGLTQVGGSLTYGSEPDSNWTFEISSAQISDIIEFKVDDNYGGDFLEDDPNKMAFSQLTVQPKNLSSTATIATLTEKGAGGANAWAFTALQNAVNQGPQGNGTQIPDFPTSSQHVGDMESVHISMIGSNRNNYRVKKIQVENKKSGTIQVETITSGWDTDGSYTLTRPGSFWEVGLGRSVFVITLLEVEPIEESSPSPPANNSPSNSFQSGQFWNLSREYYDENINAGVGKYNTYQEFLTGSKLDSTLKNFEYTGQFSFIPSYGSSVDIDFANNITEYGDGYDYINQKSLNRVYVQYNLQFNSRSDNEAKEIIEFAENTKGYKTFPFQIISKSKLSSPNEYKSLYSLQPYFIQDFICEDINVDNYYEGSSSIQLIFLNQDYSTLNIKNILQVESMPTEEKEIINEYRNKYELDIMPSYSFSRTINMFKERFESLQSRTVFGDNGENQKKNLISLNWNSVDDKKLLKLLSFFIFKQGVESFKFKIKEPSSHTGEFVCLSISHTFVYKGIHNLSVDVYETAIKKRFLNRHC